MTARRTTAMAAIAFATALTAAGCATESDDAANGTVGEATMASENNHDELADHAEHDEDSGHEDHGGHDHPEDGGPAPAGMVEAENPTYPVGTEVILTADHMPGMDGAKATIVGAFDDTYTYEVSYTPTDGGEPVRNHKWVVHEELEDAGAERLPNGAEKVMDAEHMSGMKGATATIDDSTDETVYMVDVVADGMTMKNHKWVVESEIQPMN